jgi:hypothetical protein
MNRVLLDLGRTGARSMEHSGWPGLLARVWMLPVLSGAGCGGATSSAGGDCASESCGGQPSGGSLARLGNSAGGSALGGLSFGGTRTGGASTGGQATGGRATGGTPTGGTATGGATGINCFTPTPVQPVLPVVLFAFDASTSMNDTAPSTNGQRKWDVLRQVWPDALARLPLSWAVGMMTWSCPDCPNGAYQPSLAAPIAPLDAAQLTALANALPSGPRGGNRPVECAYVSALAYMANWQAPTGSAYGPRHIVLLTDGIPTVESDCRTTTRAISQSQYDGLVTTVAAATGSSGITTFFGGIPGSDLPQGAAYDPLYQLSLLAVAGNTALPNCIPSPGTVDVTTGTLTSRGTYCHYDLTPNPELGAALQDMFSVISGAMTTCRYVGLSAQFPYVLLHSGQLDVTATIENVAVPLRQANGNDCSQGEDWYYSAFDEATGAPTEMQLCPEACARVSVDPSATVDVMAQCLVEI